VKLFAGSQFASLNATLTAFDSESGGNVVADCVAKLFCQSERARLIQDSGVNAQR